MVVLSTMGFMSKSVMKPLVATKSVQYKPIGLVSSPDESRKSYFDLLIPFALAMILCAIGTFIDVTVVLL